ncbi:MAG: protein kinase, partial [Daejeonella sp.]|uniref:serine/threonine protein kinase n=1 Tax=Daejeonella sp. TaxID=2805397 RepID=UPI003C724714
VVKILSSGITESGSLPFIEMEFIEGPDLQDMLLVPDNKVFTITESIRVAEQLSAAIAHCHKVGVKHGDIKSNNVKLNLRTDKYMLLDFGLSIMSDEQRRTSLRHAGAIEFMAPEQNEGEMLLESDVYSFGIIIYELLAGNVPFPLNNGSETSRNAVMISHMETAVPDLSETRKSNLPESWDESKINAEMQIPSWLLAIVAKCLEKLPVNRFRDGVELHEAIAKSISSKEAFAYIPLAAAVPLATAVPVEAAVPAITARPVKAPLAGSAEIPQEDLVSLSAPEPARSFKKPLIIAAVFVLIFLALFAGYRSLKSTGVDPADSAALAAENQRIADSILVTDRLNENRVQDSLDNLANNEPVQRGKGKGKGRGKKKK